MGKQSNIKQNKNREEISKSWSYQVTQWEVLLPQESEYLWGNQTPKVWALKGISRTVCPTPSKWKKNIQRGWLRSQTQPGMETHLEPCLALPGEAGERKWKDIGSQAPIWGPSGEASVLPHAWSWRSVCPNTHQKKRSGAKNSYQVVAGNGTT